MNNDCEKGTICQDLRESTIADQLHQNTEAIERIKSAVWKLGDVLYGKKNPIAENERPSCMREEICLQASELDAIACELYALMNSLFYQNELVSGE